MKKAIIYVFTGTGNTRVAADHIAHALLKHGIITTAWEARVPFPSAPDPNEFDIAGFGYPVHAYNTPQFFLRFVKSLPDVSNKQAFIFKTSGEPFCLNNASSWPLVRALKKKGFEPMMDKHLLMPYNIMFRYEDELAKQMYLHTQDMSKIIAGKVAACTPEKLHYSLWTIPIMYILRIEWFGAWINGPLMHVKKEICTGCGLCIKVCPSNNICMKNGYPHFSSRCTMCMGCAFHCPKDAVRIGVLDRWRVNGAYHYKKLVQDDNIPSMYVDDNTKGYFRLFRKYYKRTYAEIWEYEQQVVKKDGIA